MPEKEEVKAKIEWRMCVGLMWSKGMGNMLEYIVDKTDNSWDNLVVKGVNTAVKAFLPEGQAEAKKMIEG